MTSSPPDPKSSGNPDTTQSWANMVERIQADDPSGMEELYGIFTTGIRFYLCRQLGPQDLDDKVHVARQRGAQEDLIRFDGHDGGILL